MRFGQRAHRRIRIVEHRKNCRVDRGRIDQRLVALNVDDQPRLGMSRGDLRHAIGAREMIGARHRHLRPEAPRFGVDALVVGGDHDARKVPRHGNTLVNMLQHRFGADFGESFSRKPRRRVTRRNDTQNFAVHRR